jgi:hypothetical protein
VIAFWQHLQPTAADISEYIHREEMVVRGMIGVAGQWLLCEGL